MNTRIKDLAVQAGFKDEDGELSVFDGMEAARCTNQVYKLADLIVQECIAKCVGVNQYKLGFQLAREFKEHLGVRK